ncbi:hypothetical protein ACFE04_006154 [Oxalis oulophora]
MNNKPIVAGVSIILVVGVCIGVIVGVNKNNDGGTSSDDAALSTTTKSVASVCSNVDYKEACVKSLTPLANNESATPKDFLLAAISVTMQEIQATMNHTESIFSKIGKKDDARQKMALDDCKDLMQFAVEELQSSFSAVGDASMHSVSDRENEITNWLSAVISYQESCIDGFDTAPDLKTGVSDGMVNATQLTSNAIAIVSAISQLLGVFNLGSANATLTGPTRNLKEVNEEGHDNSEGMPDWVSPADRKLLASNNNANLQPNVVVAQDGSGKFKSINDALATYPKGNKGRYVIYVKAGVYHEKVLVSKDMVNVFMYGDGPRKTIVTGKISVVLSNTNTMNTATFAVTGKGFVCKGMGFQNTAGPKGEQAVALRVQADMAVFYNCRMDAYQDTLYLQSLRQFYRNCVISGTVDFIFGDSSVIIQNSLLIVRKPGESQKNTITAHGRKDKREVTALVIHNCRIVPEQLLFAERFKIETYLGRPWKEYSRTIVMESTLGDFIQPAGWYPWNGNQGLDTLYYAEYGNRGPGANTAQRVKWKGFHVIGKAEAQAWTVDPFIQGRAWIQASGAKFLAGLKY